jgi:hypothetical protein
MLNLFRGKSELQWSSEVSAVDLQVLELIGVHKQEAKQVSE